MRTIQTGTLRLRRVLALSVAATAVVAGAVACGGSSGGSSAGDQPKTAKTLRLGYFPNITHATALIGVEKGFFTGKLGSTTLKTQTFNAGPAETEALLSGALDAGYIGPNPAINAFVKTHGEAIRIIAGAASGGVQFVVRPGITKAADLAGKKIATPQLGNTQDVALRAWLKKNGFTPSSASTPGDVKVEPTDNATTLQLFKSGKIDGAWVPEPWASRLVLEGGGHVLVDEKSLWPEGKFVITHLIVRTEFLKKFPETVKELLEGQVATTAWVEKNPADAKQAANAALAKLTGKPLKAAVLDRAWSNITLTNDPVASSLKKSAADAVTAGLLKETDLKGIYDLTLLRQVLSAQGGGTVDDAGLG